MIQRIQTIFLTLAVISNLGVYFTPIYTRALEDPQKWIGFGLAISLVVAALLSGYSVVLFKNRKNQISWVKKAIWVNIVAVGFCLGVLFSLGGIGTYLWDEAIGTILVLISMAFQFLALKAINKDENLVKSIDRIR